MPNKPTERKPASGQKKDFLSEAPNFVKFFFNPRVPIAIRGGIGAVMVLIFLYPVISVHTGDSNPSRETEKSPEEKKLSMVDETPRVEQAAEVLPAANLLPRLLS